MEVVGLATIAVIGVVALVAVSAIVKGYVLSILWGWFAVPFLHLPPLGVAQAIGVALVASLLTHQYVPSKDGDTWTAITTALLTPWAALLMGWIVKSFI